MLIGAVCGFGVAVAIIRQRFDDGIRYGRAAAKNERA
jgi:hypothetical protein